MSELKVAEYLDLYKSFSSGSSCRSREQVQFIFIMESRCTTLTTRVKFMPVYEAFASAVCRPSATTETVICLRIS